MDMQVLAIPTDLVDVRTAACIAGVSTTAINKMFKTRRLTRYGVSGQYRCSLTELLNPQPRRYKRTRPWARKPADLYTDGALPGLTPRDLRRPGQ